jgi:hypothetical protein
VPSRTCSITRSGKPSPGPLLVRFRIERSPAPARVLCAGIAAADDPQMIPEMRSPALGPGRVRCFFPRHGIRHVERCEVIERDAALGGSRLVIAPGAQCDQSAASLARYAIASMMRRSRNTRRSCGIWVVFEHQRPSERVSSHCGASKCVQCVPVLRQRPQVTDATRLTFTTLRDVSVRAVEITTSAEGLCS